MTKTIEPHQFKAFLVAQPSSEILTGIVLLACRKKDKKLLQNSLTYFCREFGEAYTTATLSEMEELLLVKESKWLWGQICKDESNHEKETD